MKYIVYNTAGCGYCVQAKRLLTNKELNFDYVDISAVSAEQRGHLQEIAGKAFRTVPQIFVERENGRLDYVGGYTELKASLDEK